MNIYWYWPHPHATASSLALNMLRPGDSLTVQALPSLNGKHFNEIAEYRVIRDLPDPTLKSGGPFRKIVSPVKVAMSRSYARRQQLRSNFDIAHMQLLTYQTDWLDLKLLRTNAALVSVVHDVRPHFRKIPFSLETRTLRRLYSVAGHLVVYHQCLKDELVSDFGVDSERVDVLPLSIENRQEFREISIPNTRQQFLFFGTFRRNKGLEVLFDALDLVAPELTADFHIAGQGDKDLEKMALTRAQKHRNVNVEIGQISTERKDQLFRKSDWLLLPYTQFHSQSGVLADAYFYSIPLIASNVGALGPSVREDRTGFVVEPRSPTELARAIAQAIRCDASQFEISFAEVAKKHDVRQVGPLLRSIYEKALEFRGS